MSSDADLDRIVDAATRLFAELGFDGTSPRLIADAAGVDPASVDRLTGGKTELYREVMRRATDAEKAAVGGAAGGFTPTRQGVERLLDEYLDFYSAHPEYLGLWLHRRTGDAADTADLEEQYVRPRLGGIVEALRAEVPDDVDLDLTVWTIPWVISGFLSQRALGTRVDEEEAETDGPYRRVSPAELERFRAHLHMLLERMLMLPDAPDG
ncbi:TetR/AcrR family transcriptional regulator [Actinomadura montaniterrae]|uniref:TetR/AcrR family transcriptional regulator n=1 Tax=Actinomadura montaniterrae TaxID=1803903 RepID=A0A6L3VT01_9ACTN|nr:TetR/AcrR family transcriptional regulator [Actinomadura montaniterrae]KAB2371393.1 TetR/AcrR family transcriptional regulator [Actinomadura montaniterrae]